MDEKADRVKYTAEAGGENDDSDDDDFHGIPEIVFANAIDKSKRRDSMDSTSIDLNVDKENIEDDDASSKARKKLLIACAFIFAFMTAEIAGGVISGSLAIMTDALHLLTDLVGFGISIAALTLSRRPATRKLTFGWYRAEILGALISVILVWAITAILVMLAIQRIMANDYEIDAKVMLITSSLGVCINLFIGVQLQHGHGHGHGHSHDIGGASSSNRTASSHYGSPKHTMNDSIANKSHYGSTRNSDHDAGDQPWQNEYSIGITSAPGHGHAHAPEPENMNVRAAIMNMLGDLCQSVGVMVASLIIFFQPEYKIADPICTFLFSVLVLITTINIVRDVFYILMEGAPANLDYQQMKSDLLKIPGVKSVHHVRIWALTAAKIAMAAHVDYDETPATSYGKVLKQCRRILRKKYGITDLTLQIEVAPGNQLDD